MPFRRAFTLVEMLAVVAIIVLLLAMLMPGMSRARDYAKAARCRAHLGQLAYGHLTYATANRGRLPGMNGAVAAWKQPFNPEGIKATLPVEGGLLWQSGSLRSRDAWTCPSTRYTSPFEWYSKLGYDTEDRTDPWTFHFTYNIRVLIDPSEDDKAYPEGFNAVKRVARDTPEFEGCRKITTFTNLNHAILLAEENTGWIEPGEMIGPWKNVINDPMFVNYDTSEPRHLGHSQVSYLDGHADQIPPYIQLTTRAHEEYWPKPQR